MTEECFQQLPLEFDRTKQALLWNNGTRYPLKGIFVNEGTWPAHSTWARNPVPRQGEYSAGAHRPNATYKVGPDSKAAPVVGLLPTYIREFIVKYSMYKQTGRT